jgi:hypothetical protein
MVARVEATTAALAPETVEAITATVTRYAQAYYEGNADMMRSTLHADFVWRGLNLAGTGASGLTTRSGLSQLDAVEGGHGRAVAPSRRIAEVSVLAVDHDIASVRLKLAKGGEWLHLVHWRQRWLIVDAISEGSAP